MKKCEKVVNVGMDNAVMEGILMKRIKIGAALAAAVILLSGCGKSDTDLFILEGMLWLSNMCL